MSLFGDSAEETVLKNIFGAETPLRSIAYNEPWDSIAPGAAVVDVEVTLVGDWFNTWTNEGLLIGLAHYPNGPVARDVQKAVTGRAQVFTGVEVKHGSNLVIGVGSDAFVSLGSWPIASVKVSGAGSLTTPIPEGGIPGLPAFGVGTLFGVVAAIAAGFLIWRAVK